MSEAADMASSSGISQAQLILADAGNLIQDEAQSNSDNRKRSKGRSRDILGKLNRVVGTLETVAQLHPAATGAVKVFKALLKLETDRRENSEQIVILFHTMASMLFVLRYLDRLILDDQHNGLSNHLATVLIETSATMERFGDLADLYYNKCKQPVVRFLRSADFKARIQAFFRQFAKHRADLQNMLILRIEARTFEQGFELDQIRRNTEKIIARLGEPANEEEMKAVQIINKCGRDRVLQDKSILEQLSTLIGGGRVTGNTQVLLGTNLDELLNQNMETFQRKLESTMTQVNDTIVKAREAILQKLDSGPHELIDDPDIKAVWQGNAWKLSVKCRQFVDEITNHYEEKFRREAAMLDGGTPKDHWTLAILSKVMHHPAIGDAIDEDGSGFISLYETKDFLSQCPAGWSTPEWLVYWAIGWQMNNIKYNSIIVDTLDDIAGMCRKLIETDYDGTMSSVISQYTDKINLLRSVTAWANGIHADSNVQDLSNEGEMRLRELLEQASKEQNEILTGRMEVLKWILDDPADFPVLLGGSDVRIELMFMSILHLLIGKQHDMIKGPPKLTDGDWDIMAETLHMLITYFHERMQALLRGWRAQKLNVELNITCFAGGIYNGWYFAYNNPNGDVKRLLEKNPNTPENDYVDPAQLNARILSQIGQLSQRIDQIDSRMDSVVAMLQALLAANSVNASTVRPSNNLASAQKLSAVQSQEIHTKKSSNHTKLFIKAAKKVGSELEDLGRSSSPNGSSPQQGSNANLTGDQDDDDAYLDLYYTRETESPRSGIINGAALIKSETINSYSSEGELSLKSPEQQSSGYMGYGSDPIINQPISSGLQGIDSNLQQGIGNATRGLASVVGDPSFMNGLNPFPNAVKMPDNLPWKPDAKDLKAMGKGLKLGMKVMSHVHGPGGDTKGRTGGGFRERLASLGNKKSGEKGHNASTNMNEGQNEERRKGMAFPGHLDFGDGHMVRSGPPTYSDRVSPYPSTPSSATWGKISDYRSPSIPGTPIPDYRSLSIPGTPIPDYRSLSIPGTPIPANPDPEDNLQKIGGLVNRIRKKASSKSLSKEGARQKPHSDSRFPQLGSAGLNRPNLYNEMNPWPS